jgi:hypothetical protein
MHDDDGPPILPYTYQEQPEWDLPGQRCGSLLVTGEQVLLPPLCVVFGEHAQHMIKQDVMERGPVQLTQRKVVFRMGLCSRHMMRRDLKTKMMPLGYLLIFIVGSGIYAASVLPGFQAFIQTYPWVKWGLMGTLAAIVGVMVYARYKMTPGPVFKMRRGDLVFFTGVHERVLDSLEEVDMNGRPVRRDRGRR